eukprot:TRINITY_DN39135_c0_g1_i1.p1 TRINITY_DN39135_c0_g1~~TRINITY_DN39135_c0_g1_i1.p1  ORF type:complete len:317 (-),score=64.99 TRINITY_DN39135_c0_g1_i1:44-994(-)
MSCEEGEWRLLNPLAIRFSQPRVAPHFRDGHLLRDTVNEVYDAYLQDAGSAGAAPKDAAVGVPPFDTVLVPPFPAIRVISWHPKIRRPDGEAERDVNGDQILGKRAWFALDNRRLHTLQCAAAKRWPRRCCVAVKCIEEVPGSTIKELRKFRTTTEGRSIDVGMRQGDTRPFHWTHVAPPGARSQEIEAEGLFVEDLFDALQWAPQAVAMASRASQLEQETDQPQGGTEGYGGGKKEVKIAPCPENGWQYMDPAGRIQGPFPLEKMRLWHQHNFFYADLPMRSDPVDAFLPFAKLFPPGEVPFSSRVFRYRQKVQQ